MIEFVGPNGEALTREEWEELFHARVQNMAPESWWRKLTVVDGVRISTVWVGLTLDDDGYGAWETMVGDRQWKYATRQEAFDDHERIIRQLAEVNVP